MKFHLFKALSLTLPLLFTKSFATKISFDAIFDDVTVIPAEPLLNVITIYRNLSFTNFDFSQPGVANESLNGVLPHSNPNHASLFNQPGKLTVLYPGSKVKSLSLTSFYYGCNTALFQSEVSVAVACNVTVTGYRAGSAKAAATQTFEFEPAEAVDLQNEPSLGIFTTAFQGLQNVSFTFVPTDVAVLLIDDLVGSVQT